ncbi:PE domain-containing protein [Pseudonocardia sp. NPDC049635]|uniref:PE domain-containing protein n=1 Tax=Pseudonocardia sp. NPDC049635 TaxID=3155506 RepID=UPI0033F432DE
MTSPAHIPRGVVSDGLLLQVDTTNVLQIRDVLVAQIDSMKRALTRAERQLSLGPCGDDPISLRAAERFAVKIKEIQAAHWAHVAELQDAADRLAEAARHYGFTEDQLGGSFASSPSATARPNPAPPGSR